MTNRLHKSVYAFALTAAAAVSAHAGVIQSAVAATASSTFFGCCAIERTIDQSGLQVGFTSGVTDFATYMAGNPLHGLEFQNEWFSPFGTTSATVVYDMGSILNIGKMAYWNEDAANGRLSFNAFVSTDGVTYSQVGSNLTPTDNAGNQPYPADVFSWTEQSMRYVKLEMTCDWCAIGEVAFSVSAPAVPEPSTYALMVGGLLAVAGLSRRRQRR